MPPSYPNSFRGFSDVPGTLWSTNAANADSPEAPCSPSLPEQRSSHLQHPACWKHRGSHTKAQARVACLQPTQKPCPTALHKGPVQAGMEAEPACVDCLCSRPKPAKAALPKEATCSPKSQHTVSPARNNKSPPWINPLRRAPVPERFDDPRGAKLTAEESWNLALAREQSIFDCHATSTRQDHRCMADGTVTTPVDWLTLPAHGSLHENAQGGLLSTPPLKCTATSGLEFCHCA